MDNIHHYLSSTWTRHIYVQQKVHMHVCMPETSTHTKKMTGQKLRSTRLSTSPTVTVCFSAPHASNFEIICRKRQEFMEDKCSDFRVDQTSDSSRYVPFRSAFASYAPSAESINQLSLVTTISSYVCFREQSSGRHDALAVGLHSACTCLPKTTNFCWKQPISASLSILSCSDT